MLAVFFYKLLQKVDQYGYRLPSPLLASFFIIFERYLTGRHSFFVIVSVGIIRDVGWDVGMYDSCFFKYWE